MAKKWTGIVDIADEFAPGDPPPSGYCAWHEWAAIQHKAGLRQTKCGGCGLYRFPQELSDRALVSCPIDGKTFEPAPMVTPVCHDCAKRGCGVPPGEVEARVAATRRETQADIERIAARAGKRATRPTPRNRHAR